VDEGEMDSATLTFLLRGEHRSMPDRIDRGLWPHAPFAFDQVVNDLAAVLATGRWFPFQGREAEPERAISEWRVVERRPADHFVCCAQSFNPSDPRDAPARSESSFRTPEEATRWYWRWALHLAGDLDGWKVQ
jgi:hypothetical protein